MKKAFSVLLLLTFLFNLGGYYFFFWAMKVHAAKELSVRLDEGKYSEQKTFEIKIPISLPYPLQNSEFERQTGNFVYNHEHYQLVKQKYENDTLTIVCIKDIKNKQLTDVMDSFSESSSNHPLQDGSVNIPMKVLSEYISCSAVIMSANGYWSRSIEPTIHGDDVNIHYLTISSPPPKYYNSFS